MTDPSVFLFGRMGLDLRGGCQLFLLTFYRAGGNLPIETLYVIALAYLQFAA